MNPIPARDNDPKPNQMLVTCRSSLARKDVRIILSFGLDQRFTRNSRTGYGIGGEDYDKKLGLFSALG